MAACSGKTALESWGFELRQHGFRHVRTGYGVIASRTCGDRFHLLSVSEYSRVADHKLDAIGRSQTIRIPPAAPMAPPDRPLTDSHSLVALRSSIPKRAQCTSGRRADGLKNIPKPLRHCLGKYTFESDKPARINSVAEIVATTCCHGASWRSAGPVTR